MDDVSKKEASVTASIQERADWLCTFSDAIWDRPELAHKGMLYAAKVLSGAGIDLLTRPELVAKAKADWTAQLRGRVYRPLPPEIQPW